MKKHQTEIKWQAALYGFYALIGWIQAYFEQPQNGLTLYEFVSALSVSLSECALVNVLANWLMLKYPVSTQPLRYFLGLFLTFIGFLFYRYLTVFPDFVDNLKTYNGSHDRKSFSFFFFINTVTFMISLLIAYGLYSIKKSVRMERRARNLESEVNEARMTILKHQINPHFLYNTLSYMYAQARPVSENLSKSILILSDMMRYSLNKTEDSSLTLIEKEIQYIENYIEIHRLRFDKNFYLNFEIEGVIGNKKIVPLLLITFIENAIKHGKINDPLYPVNIRILIDKIHLTLFVENHKQQGRKDETSGIGLENTKKRLNLVYPNAHKLTITNELDYFAINLKIDF